MKEWLKTIFMYIIKIILTPLKLFPIKYNYIMFCTNSGKGYFCNPKYIYEELIKLNKKDMRYIWCFKDKINYEGLNNNNTIICKYHSLKYYYYKIRSGIYISNSIEGNEVPKKKKQIRIQTWHGGGSYKKVALSEKGKSKIFKKRTEENIKNTNLFISSSKVFTDIIRDNFQYNGNVLECGMPRNDILFNESKKIELKQKILSQYNIQEDTLLVLYAPTWRYDESKLEKIDFLELKKHIKLRFNKEVVILYRAHFHMSKCNELNVIDVSNYEDMQELLIASDVLISDYSSSIWDYSFLYRPCFLFCPDLDYYIEKRGFVIDIWRWGFPVAKNNKELIKEIDEFDNEKFRNNMVKHHEMLGSYETGNSTKQVVNYINEIIK